MSVVLRCSERIGYCGWYGEIPQGAGFFVECDTVVFLRGYNNYRKIANK